MSYYLLSYALIIFTMEPAILSASKVLNIGLRLGGAVKVNRHESLKRRIAHFKSAYGSHPLVYARLWHELQLVDLERKFIYFLMTLDWMVGYNTEEKLSFRYGFHEDTIRDWTWYYAECLEILEEIKVSNGQCLISEQ